jgi:hypothetical protein
MGCKSFFEAITNPQTINWVRGAFRTVAFVSLPLYTIAIHPNTRMRLGYPMMMIASVVSTSTHQLSLGLHIGIHTWLWRGVVYMLIFGTVINSWSLHAHTGAWYGMLAFGIFLASLVSHGMMRRFMYLYFFIYMLEIRTMSTYYARIPLNIASWSAADYFIGSLTGVAALCFPYPIMTKSLVDMIMGKLFGGFGKMFMAMITFVHMPDAHTAQLFFNDRSPFIKIEAILDVMAPLLWFSNWEPTEFPLHNPIRRLKLSFLRRVIALTYAAFGTGRSVAELRRQQAQMLAIHKIRVTLINATYGRRKNQIENSSKVERSDSSFVSPSTKDALNDEDGTGGTSDAAQQEMEKAMKALHDNSEKYAKEFGVVLMQCMTLLGTVTNTPEQIVKSIPFDNLQVKQTQMRRAIRLEMLQVMKLQSEMVLRRLAEQQRKEHRAFPPPRDSNEEEEVAVVDDNSPYGRLHRYTIGREDAVTILESHGAMDQTAIFLRLSELYFHLLLAMIAGELISFGEQMKTYKPSMSLGHRLLRFFIIEPWNDFWSELWCIFTVARPCDRRTLKDAVRMTCAYLSATALNLELYFIPGGTYYFGTTLLLGLPVEEESLNMSINRMAGNALGCALGFMAYHNTNNLAQRIAMTLCFAFVLRACKEHPLYGQTFLYSAAITMASMSMSTNTEQLMTRLITSNYTIIAYMLCCMFIFPNNNIKICWGYRCKLTKVMSEVIDDVALTLRIKPEYYPALIGSDEVGNNAVAYPLRNTEAMQMCSQLNVQMALTDRLLAMCDKWTPFAARQHVIRGSTPFPTSASTMIQFSHKRMVAHLRMLVFGVQLLHRPRAEPVSAVTKRLLSGSIGDFLEEFAGCARLVSQDFIDSLQASRKWSYPLTLSHTSQLSWMRVRLFAIHIESYAIAAKHMSRSTLPMKPTDYDLLREEATMHTEGELHVNAGANSEEAVQHGTANDGCPLDLQPNMSFADRFLAVRRQGEALMEQDNDPETLEQLHNSMYLPLPREVSFFGYGGVAQRSFAYHAPLQETAVMPNDAFPFTQESAEQSIQQRLRDAAPTGKEKRDKTAPQEGEGSDSPKAVVADESAGDRSASVPPYSSLPQTTRYEPVKPAKTRSKLSRLILVQDEGPELELPLYRGPDFTFVEDELATENDTDFSALMTILCSVYGLIEELEGLTGSMNTISTYQKELHESALAIGLIDKVAEKVTSYRKRIYDRYHLPSPAEEQRRPLHAQSDPFADWRF